LVLTASDDRKTKLRALELGATDFLAKPADPSELIPRVRNCLVVKAHQDHLRHYAQELEREVSKRTAQLEASTNYVIYCLARAAEFRDDETGRHVLRVGRYAGIIARQLGWSESQAVVLEQAAQLHDVGKIGIPDAVLLKPGKLTPEEFEIVRKHCGFGKKIFEPMTADEWHQWQYHAELGRRIIGDTTAPVLQMAARIALTHHERWDGSGYPLGLASLDIPIEGRITAVADVFDALSTSRSYKPAFPLDRCFSILEDGRGSHFDPEVLDAFFAARGEVLQAQILFAEVD
jgi:putative two-component system response regulator